MMSLRVLRRSADDFNGGTRTQHPHMVLNLFRFFSRGPHRPHAISTRNHLFCSRWRCGDFKQRPNRRTENLTHLLEIWVSKLSTVRNTEDDSCKLATGRRREVPTPS